ncbi:F-box/FBD/LRR-repeat protein [Tanacetum coccineum]|uniref:F-box/FBD/LRR-repeat protein n=1 Tax=Tanacetum coccineum TaxID=301880 RepID=A0ABQ5JDZ6_9ASTR
MDDRISNLTSPMIENILCLVPIQEAARTSILSKEWRYHWTKIPKLVINEGTFQVSPGKGDQHSKRQKLYDAIYQILLQHEGPIHEFTLSTYAGDACYEIDRIISHLPFDPIYRKLPLKLGGYTFPISLSPLNQLTDLYLSRCFLNYQSAFNGFGSLTNLYMKDVYTSKRMLLHLLSNSPLIKSLTLNIGNGHLQENPERDSVAIEDLSDISLEHLTELEIRNLTNRKCELDFVKLVLAKCCVLKKVNILLYNKVDKYVKLQILGILLSSPRASLGVEIICKRDQKC